MLCLHDRHGSGGRPNCSHRSRSCSELAIAQNYFIPVTVTATEADSMSDTGYGDDADLPRGEAGPPRISSCLG